MNRRLVVTISLSLSLAGVPAGVLAQQTAAPVISGNVNGRCVAGGNAGDSTITCGDLNPAPDMTVIMPAGEERRPAPSDMAPGPAPVSNAATDPVAVDDPATDLPADAVADTAAEPDTDGDGLSDDYEINVYATDPGLWDTDGDGLSDGDEVLNTGTDPFLWDTDGDGVADGDGEATRTDPLDPASAAGTTDEPALDAASEDSDADRLADSDEATVGTDPSTPDSDGDGYYDGDEVILGTDALDPASFPVASDSSESP